MSPKLIKTYDSLVLKHPLGTLIAITLIVVFFLLQTPEFELDASADSLVLENDASLKYYRGVRDKYGSDEFLIVTYSPENPLFSEQVLADIARLRDELSSLEQVASVVSLLDVPLVDSPPMSLSQIVRQVRTLESEDVDMRLAEKELRQSALYENLLVNSEGDTTALQVNLTVDRELLDLLNNRDKLYPKVRMNPDSRERLDELSAQIKIENLAHKVRLEQTIVEVRKIMDGYRDGAVLFLGGVPMITSDSIAFIRSDLKVFGVGVILFLVVILAVSFRHSRWVVLPLGVCLISAGTMIGYLGWMQWPVTVVSSNFVSLLLIITLSLIIHLIVRYRELATLKPGASQSKLVRSTVYSKFTPSFFTAVTTIVAFGSLLVSGIRPVIDFGWMMVIGIVVSFLLAFTLFPAALMLLPRLNTPITRDMTGKVTSGIADFIQYRTRAALTIFVVLVAIGLTGLPRLSVDNRFIDYYKDDTEIYQGMSLIDNKLGGTTPLDVIIDAPADEVIELEDLGEITDITANSYWFNRDGLRDVARIHQYLDQLPETGKVLSVHTGMQLLESLNNDKPYNDFKLAVVYKRLPDDVKKALINPYLSQDGNQLRFSIRLFESDKTLRRQELLDKIYFDLIDKFDLDPEQVTISGVAVLFNNLLQSLFKSQILTLGAVFVAILLMFILLFGSARLALAAIVPNIIAAGLILGLMGWIGIPLDIMTITIAAIAIGIGVDDSIHYVHRFRGEFLQDRNHWAAVRRCHNSIARAMYYTSVTVVLGFSILVLSNFIPTIYFGLLSGLAMITALMANLVLLPILMVRFRLS